MTSELLILLMELCALLQLVFMNANFSCGDDGTLTFYSSIAS